MNFERRLIGGELRVTRSEKGLKIGGTGIVFSRWSEDLGGFREQVSPSAARQLDEAGVRDLRSLFNHDANFVLGRLSAGTMRVSVTPAGIVYEVDAPDVQWARDLAVSIERGDITGNSFQFRTNKDSWEKIGDEHRRTLLDIEISEMGPVTWPAYPQTDVAVRSLDQWRAIEAKRGPSTDILRRRLSLDEIST